VGYVAKMYFLLEPSLNAMVLQVVFGSYRITTCTIIFLYAHRFFGSAWGIFLKVYCCKQKAYVFQQKFQACMIFL